jgi:hypothetical protein
MPSALTPSSSNAWPSNLVLQCVRHSHLEDLDAGIAPSSATGDYADVTVISPFGSIPWPRVSRFKMRK